MHHIRISYIYIYVYVVACVLTHRSPVPRGGGLDGHLRAHAALQEPRVPHVLAVDLQPKIQAG